MKEQIRKILNKELGGILFRETIESLGDKLIRQYDKAVDAEVKRRIRQRLRDYILWDGGTKRECVDDYIDAYLSDIKKKHEAKG